MTLALQNPLLAQDSVAVEAQIALFLQQILSPAGIAATVVGAGVLLAAIVFRKVLPVMGGIAMASVTFQLHPDALTINVLLGPLQAFRYSSKSIAFGLLILAGAAAINLATPRRGRSVGFATVTFFAFQLYYISQVLVFADMGFARGAFGTISTTLMFVVFGYGFGRRLDSPESTREALCVFAWVGSAFVATNVVQLALGRGGAIVAGRLAGICGNAQMMGAVSTMLLVGNAYLAGELRRTRITWWLAVANSGLLALLIVATGSRTAVLSSGIALLFIFRRQVGRAVLVAIPVALVFAIASEYVAETGDAVSRMAEAPNTRAEVWRRAFGLFQDSPVIGNLPFGGDPDALGVESTFLRTLATLGLIGGLIVVMPFGAMLLNCVRANWLAKADANYRRLADLYIGSSMAVLVFNILDGYAFGLLTFPVVFMYMNFSLGDFLASEARVAAEGQYLEPDSVSDAWAT
jgi:hypothetical protein